MTNTLRNIALRITAAVLCGLILLNAYLVSKNLKLIHKTTTERMEALDLQADISNVLLDLQEMETGQRGYLLTGDPSYLKPYSEANGRLAAHLAELHSTLAVKPSQDRLLEGRLESLAELKIEEMNETIRLRELGYRHKALQIVSSNRGKELMDEARASLDALASAQTRNIARYDAQMRENISTAMKELIFATCILFGVTVVTLLAFDSYRKRLEIRCARHAEELQATTLQLEQFTSTIFNDVRALVGKMRSYANALLDVSGCSCPRRPGKGPKSGSMTTLDVTSVPTQPSMERHTRAGIWFRKKLGLPGFARLQESLTLLRLRAKRKITLGDTAAVIAEDQKLGSGRARFWDSLRAERENSRSPGY